MYCKNEIFKIFLYHLIKEFIKEFFKRNSFNFKRMNL